MTLDWVKSGQLMIATFLGALTFYTCIPLPRSWMLKFDGIARYAALVGVLLGVALGLLDRGLDILGMPLLLRSAVVVVSWIGLTGGLHLDGAMDTADGLAVPPSRRLEVMADSHTGAFGVMAAIALILLKTLALASIPSHRPLALALAAGWGRWGQLVAIARDHYLKPTGKGAFHKQAIRSLREAVPSGLLLSALSALWHLESGGIVVIGYGSMIALTTGAYFRRQLGGQTGDTYGAIVEWSEALFLCCLTVL